MNQLKAKRKAAPGLDNWKSGNIQIILDTLIIPRPSGRGKGVTQNG